MLNNLHHRGAQGCDPCTGDGAGILLQISHEFFGRVPARIVGIHLPESGGYGVGMVFFPRAEPLRRQCEGLFESIVREEGIEIFGMARCAGEARTRWRAGPKDPASPFRQCFIARDILNEAQFERKLYIVRKRMDRAIRESALGERERRVCLQFIVQHDCL